MKEPLGKAARDQRTEAVRERAAASCNSMLSAVAEEVATRHDIPAPHKIKILLAIVRTSRAPEYRIESIEDVDRLALSDPQQYDRLLDGYWRLLGARKRVR